MKIGFVGMVALAALAYAPRLPAAEWRNIGDGDYVAGAKISSPEKLCNRVVIVDVWGVNCPPCRALLPTLQKIWENYGLPADKPLVVLGSHRQARDDERVKALVAKAGVTYPVYQGAGLAKDEPSGGGVLPFVYVLNHRGKVVYKGRDVLEAQEAAITALGDVGRLPSLTDGVRFTRFKNLEGQLALGRPVKTITGKLKAVAAGKDAQAAAEARAILDGIERGLAATKEEIDMLKTCEPREALRLIKLMKVTWPEEAEAAYKAEVPALISAAKKRKAGK